MCACHMPKYIPTHIVCYNIIFLLVKPLFNSVEAALPIKVNQATFQGDAYMYMVKYFLSRTEMNLKYFNKINIVGT